MVRIRRFGIVKTSTTVALLYVVIVAIFGIPFALLAAAAGGVPTGTGGTVGFVEVLTIVLIAAIAYGVFGWIFTALACGLYNLAAGLTGGIEVQVESVAPPPPVPVWGPSAGTGTGSSPTTS